LLPPHPDYPGRPETDGTQVGVSRQTFTIQSVSKPFVYGLALADLGVERVLAKVGVEPSGEAFNSISLEPGTGRPLNPMISVSCRWPAFNPAPPMWVSATAGPAGTSPLRRSMQG
jgi:hypothetical protein